MNSRMMSWGVKHVLNQVFSRNNMNYEFIGKKRNRRHEYHEH